MARNNTGNYALPTSNPVQFGTLIDPAWANGTLTDLGTAMTDSLSRSGKGGMLANLNMGGHKVAGAAGATLSTDLPTALQVRSGAFSYLFPVSSDASGNAYTGTSSLPDAPVAGTVFYFIADKTNTGPMTLSVNGGATLPIRFNGVAAQPGTVEVGAAVQVVLYGNMYRAIGASNPLPSLISVESTLPAALTGSVVDGVLTLAPHVNIPDGLVTLDPTGRIPPNFWPTTPQEFKGAWNAYFGALPDDGTANGQYYILTVGGTLDVYHADPFGNYATSPIPVDIGGVLVWQQPGSARQPRGWYYIEPIAANAASQVVNVATSLFPTAEDLQSWIDQANTYMTDALLKTGGTISGNITATRPPDTIDDLVSAAYVALAIAAINTGVLSFNGRTASAAVLVSADVTTALGFTPANIGGDTFTGPISSPVIGSAAFVPLPKIANTAGVQALDFLEAQTQILTLTATTSFSAINNFPVGSIMRLTLKATNLVVTSWPAAVVWPGTGTPPDLTTGTEKIAIIVIENDGTNYLAAASVY